MSSDRAKRALQLFEACLEVPPDDRSGWIVHECGADQALAADVHSLLQAHANSASFLEQFHDTPLDSTLNSESYARIEPGQRFGDFVVQKQIGAGGMGLVYRAEQTSLNRSVALKVLSPYLSASESARSRFQREVEAAARLDHPNIVAVFTRGQEAAWVYYAMELVDGPTLSDLVLELRQNPLPELQDAARTQIARSNLLASTHKAAQDATALSHVRTTAAADVKLLTAEGSYFATVAKLIADVADALRYAHQLQVIHRDIKPSNLFLSADGVVHIGDFGLARIAQEPGLTKTGDFLGTPYYMAPEQISTTEGEVDDRTDIYALGATLYELLTLTPPHRGENREQVIAHILNEEPIPPRKANRSVPRDLETICLKCLEKPPAGRYQSAEELADDLRRYSNGLPIQARRISPFDRTVRWVRRQPWTTLAAAGVLLLLVATSFFAYRNYLFETRWMKQRLADLYETAELASLSGDLQQAINALDEAESLGAPEAQLLMLRGQIDQLAGDFQAACDKLELAREQMPESLAVYALLARAYRSNEEHEKAYQVSQRLEAMQPATLQDYLLLGQAQINSDFGRALSTLDHAVQLDKSSVQARLVRGTALTERALDTADTVVAEKALEDLNIARELVKSNPFLLSIIVQAELAAATAYEVMDDEPMRQKHLRQAAAVAEELLEFPDQYISHRWRAYYFDYIGDDQHAIEEWMAMKDWQIAHLLLTLFAHGAIDQGLQLCDERMQKYPHARFTHFFRSLLLSAKATKPADFLHEFVIEGEETLDDVNAHRFHYTIHCLAGDLDAAREKSRSFRGRIDVAPDFDLWRSDFYRYTCGELDEGQLLAESSSSRTALCQAEFYVGMTNLAQGKRTEARQHFEASAQYRLNNYLEDHLSRALLVQLANQPEWPNWIEKK